MKNFVKNYCLRLQNFFKYNIKNYEETLININTCVPLYQWSRAVYTSNITSNFKQNSKKEDQTVVCTNIPSLDIKDALISINYLNNNREQWTDSSALMALTVFDTFIRNTTFLFYNNNLENAQVLF